MRRTLYLEALNMQVSVIIVSFRVKDYLEQCLHSVVRAMENIEAEIFVVDNASGDTTIERLRPLFPAVQWIANTHNLGFARANNQALEKCSGEFVLFLNPDTLIGEDCLRHCIGKMHAQQEVGALGVKMLNGKGRFLPESKRSFPSPLVSFCKMSGLASLFPRSAFFNRYALGNLDEDRDHEVDILAGAFLFTRREILRRIGGFDERFFLYGEDIDLSHRIRQAGWKNLYFSGVTIIHFKGESSSGPSLARLRYFYQAMLVFVRKHYRSGAAGFFSILLKTAIALRATVSVAKRMALSILPEINTIPPDIWVMGSEKEFGEVSALMAGHKIVLERVPIELDQTGKSGARNQLSCFIKEKKPQVLLFCTGTLTLSEIITLVSVFKDQPTRFLFHASGSKSILGGGIVLVAL